VKQDALSFVPFSFCKKTVLDLPPRLSDKNKDEDKPQQLERASKHGNREALGETCEDAKPKEERKGAEPCFQLQNDHFWVHKSSKLS